MRSSSEPADLSAHRWSSQPKLINTDSVPGKANRLLARYAKTVFVQFEQSKEHFPNRQVEVVGCPLRSDFQSPDRHKAFSDLANRQVEVVGCPLRSDFQSPDRHKAFSDLVLEEGKKVLLVTGASSGAANINDAMLSILDELAEFAADWQVVHLTGVLHIDEVQRAVAGLDMSYYAVDYYDDMASLLAAADVVVGRAGAVSVAEFAAAGVPAVCLPYPYHKDNHQALNAQALVDAGAAVIVDDDPDSPGQTARDLLGALKDLLGSECKRTAMTAAAKDFGTTAAAKS
jgi:UDP-N-acetylglucosamine--N-acetylmuramyl-(pentapeptide) pyrophosphoryl-undecaprenol N-acetylglucosamine transferase